MRKFSEVYKALLAELEIFSAGRGADVGLGDLREAESDSTDEPGCPCHFIHR